jgi:hypothetical protein
MKARSTGLPEMRRGFALGALLLALVAALWLGVFAPDAHAKTLRLDGVTTTLTTDPATTTLLFGAGIIPLPIAPSFVAPTADAAKYTFPITGGSVDAKTLAGAIRHSGGLLLARRNQDNTWTALSLANFTIRIDASPDLTAAINGAARASIADLDLGDATISKYMKNHRQYIRIANVAVTLNKTATDAIEATFLGGADALPDNVKLGTATVAARAAR